MLNVNKCKRGGGKIPLTSYVVHGRGCNPGSRWKLQKMARENFSIGAFYNVSKNQANASKTVGRDSFLSPKTP